jgi:cytochrome c551/c552
MRKPILKKLSRIFLLLFTFNILAVTVFAQDGEALFKANCTSCHAINDKVIGPALKNTHSKHSEEWMVKWIKNSQAMVKAGDPDAVKLFNDNNKIVMTSFNLKDDEIKAIIGYIKTESEKAPATVVSPTGPQPGQEEKGKATWVYLVLAAFVLFLISGVLRRVQTHLAKAVRAKEGLPEPVKMTRWKSFVHWSRNNKKLLAVILIVIFVWGNVKGWYSLKAIGVTTGYTPDQPIKYSHMLHAGDMKIACVYCHSGAEKGKVAGVPSANVCMNCHKFVKKGPTTGTEEIAKIYKALDYDPDKGTYGPNPKPIQWVRVHNLPDLAYFNHSQHVVVGKVECQTCHGDVQNTYTVAGQHSPLTMAWCIDCHRKTNVKMAGNHYYDDYHQKLLAKYGNDSLITVERIGGTECARCHY